MNNTLVLFAHPYFEKSVTNARLVDAYKNVPGVIFRDLYEDYPDFDILADKERKALMVYDTFIFHFPLIWFGIPPLLKLWIDEVFDRKWITATKEANPLYGRKMHIVLTIESSFRPAFGGDLFTFDAKVYLKPLIECINVCNMQLGKVIAVANEDKVSFQELEKYYMEIKNLMLER